MLKTKNTLHAAQMAVIALGLLGLFGTVGCKKQLDQMKQEQEERVEAVGGQPKRILDSVKKKMTDENAKREAAALEAATE